MNDNRPVHLAGWLSETPLGFCLWFRDGGGVLLSNLNVEDRLVDQPVLVSGAWNDSRVKAEHIEFDQNSVILWRSGPPRYQDGGY